MADDNFLLQKTAANLRAHPETLAVRVSREHYLWLANEIDGLWSQIIQYRHEKDMAPAHTSPEQSPDTALKTRERAP